MEGEEEQVRNLSNAATSDDVEWTLTRFQGHTTLLMLNISQTATDTAIV